MTDPRPALSDAQLEKLKQRWDTSGQRRWTASTILADATPYIDALVAEVRRSRDHAARLAAALEHYATMPPISCRLTTAVGETEGQIDLGEVARAALFDPSTTTGRAGPSAPEVQP